MKRSVSLLALISFTASASGCISLKLADSKPGSLPLAAICEKRTAVLVLEDRRMVTGIDRALDGKPTVAVSRALADKFREHCPDTVVFIDRQADAAGVKPAAAVTAAGNFDYLLTGTLDKLQSEYEDEYRALRMAVGFIAGLTAPVGLLLLPIAMIGDSRFVTDFNFTLWLVDAASGTVLWSGKSEFSDRETIAAAKANGARVGNTLNTQLASATSAMFANVSSLYQRSHGGLLALRR